MSLFTRLAQALNAKGARLDFEMVALGDGHYRAMMTPNLGACPENASDEERQLRALLASPLTISGTASDIDEALEQRLAERIAIQNEGLASLDALREKMKAAAAAAEKAKPKAASQKASAATASAAKPDDDDDVGAAKVSRSDTAKPTLEDF
jgi:PRTRC genetic system protein E